MGRVLTTILFIGIHFSSFAQYQVIDCYSPTINNHSEIKYIPNSVLYIFERDTFDFNCSKNKLIEYKDSTCSREFRYKGKTFKVLFKEGRLQEYSVYKKGVLVPEYGNVSNGNGTNSYSGYKLVEPVKLVKPKGYINVFKNGYLVESKSKEKEKYFFEYKTKYDSLGNILQINKKYRNTETSFSCVNGRISGNFYSKEEVRVKKNTILNGIQINDNTKTVFLVSQSTYINGWLTERKQTTAGNVTQLSQYKLGKKHGLFIENGKKTYYLIGRRKGKKKPAGL